MPTLEDGQVFQRYRIIRWLGSGVAGETYEAEDRSLKRKVALKLIHPWATLPDAARRQFFREIQGISLLNHPYLASILDYGEVDGRVYVARRYISSGSLLGSEGRLWFRTPLPITDAFTYTQQLAQALHYIHQHGYMHGGMTFSNIMVLRGPNLENEKDYAPFLLADIGLSNFVRRFGQPKITALPVSAAPEQLGRRVTPASDQFALAVLVYFWLAGRPPFLGTPDEVEQMKLSGKITPLSVLNPQVSFDQDGIILHALGVYPEERYPSTLVFAEALMDTLRFPSRIVPVTLPEQTETPSEEPALTGWEPQIDFNIFSSSQIQPLEAKPAGSTPLPSASRTPETIPAFLEQLKVSEPISVEPVVPEESENLEEALKLFRTLPWTTPEQQPERPIGRMKDENGGEVLSADEIVKALFAEEPDFDLPSGDAFPDEPLWPAEISPTQTSAEASREDKTGWQLSQRTEISTSQDTVAQQVAGSPTENPFPVTESGMLEDVPDRQITSEESAADETLLLNKENWNPGEVEEQRGEDWPEIPTLKRSDLQQQESTEEEELAEVPTLKRFPNPELPERENEIIILEDTSKQDGELAQVNEELPERARQFQTELSEALPLLLEQSIQTKPTALEELLAVIEQNRASEGESEVPQTPHPQFPTFTDTNQSDEPEAGSISAEEQSSEDEEVDEEEIPTIKKYRLPMQEAVSPRLIVSSPFSQSSYEFLLRETETNIGRAGSSDLHLEQDNLTSRHHALIKRVGEHVLVFDKRSYNGVYINGQKIEPERGYELSDGDHISIGNYELIFRYLPGTTISQLI